MKINSYKWGWWQSPTIGKTNGVFTSTHMNVWCQVMCTDMYKNDSKNYFPQDLNMKFSILRLSGMSVLQFLLDNRNIVEILWEKKWSKLQVRNNINNTSPSCFNSHPLFAPKAGKTKIYFKKNLHHLSPPANTPTNTLVISGFPAQRGVHLAHFCHKNAKLSRMARLSSRFASLSRTAWCGCVLLMGRYPALPPEDAGRVWNHVNS